MFASNSYLCHQCLKQSLVVFPVGKLFVSVQGFGLWRPISSTVVDLRERVSWSNNIVDAYQSKIHSENFKDDKYQMEAVNLLQELDEKLLGYVIKQRTKWSKLFHSVKKIKEPKVRGLYLHGSVGCGKTMLMDLFYDNCCIDPSHKKRVHFHSFMMDFHNRLHDYKQKHRSFTKKHPVKMVAEQITNQTWLLCLDELQITDVADAMIMKLLFCELFSNGLVLVSTSNRSPDELYRQGIQRTQFLPFIPMVKKFCRVHHLSSGIDYRRFIGECQEKVFHVKNKETDRNLDTMFKVLANEENDVVQSKTINIKDRNLTFQKACGGVLDSSFNELCNRPLGAMDYVILSECFHTIIIRDIPKMTGDTLNQARRFITMIDTFYEKRTRVIFSSDVQCEQLFSLKSNSVSSDDTRKLLDDLGLKETDGKTSAFTGDEELFAFDRTLSRIHEMQGEQYWNLPRTPSGL